MSEENNTFRINNDQLTEDLSISHDALIHVQETWDIRFIPGGEEKGRLYEKDGKLHFEGDVDESAQAFFDSIITNFQKIPEVPGDMKELPKDQVWRKRPVYIRAIQYDGTNIEQLQELNRHIIEIPRKSVIVIPTMEGDMLGKVGCFVIQGVHGEVYPCEEKIFYKTYEQ